MLFSHEKLLLVIIDHYKCTKNYKDDCCISQITIDLSFSKALQKDILKTLSVKKLNVYCNLQNFPLSFIQIEFTNLVPSLSSLIAPLNFT